MDFVQTYRGWLLLTVILAVTVAAYYPSLFHCARADQVSFLAEYGMQTSWKDLTFGVMDYNRTRLFSPGDSLLFRPLLFVFLGIQKIFFGYNFFWWQVVALGAHLFTVAALWRLLLRWGGPGSHAAAAVFSLFFSLLFVNVEAVVWHGITPYVFFAGLIILALERLEKYIVSDGEDRVSLAECTGILFAAVLIYEAAVWYIPCFFMVTILRLFRLKQVKFGVRAMVLLLPLAVYLTWSLGHFFLSGAVVEGEVEVMMSVSILGLTAENFIKLVKWFLAGGLFLQGQDVRPFSRMMVAPELLGWDWPMFSGFISRWTGAAAAVFMLAAVIVSLRSFREGWRVGLLGLMLTGYVLILTVGRANVRADGTGLESSLYYFYNFWVLATVILFVTVQGLFKADGWRRFLAAGLGMAVIVFSLFNAWQIRQLTARMARDHQACIILVKTVDALIAEHSKETGFSFYVSPSVPGNFIVSWLVKKGDPAGRQYTYAEALYPLYFNAVAPKYIIHNGSRQGL